MYDHPIKRAGLAFNRILLSNTKMVLPCFPNTAPNRFKLEYKIKYYMNGKETHRQYVKANELDEMFPSRRKV